VSSTDDDELARQGLVEPQRQAAADWRLLAGVVVFGWQPGTSTRPTSRKAPRRSSNAGNHADAVGKPDAARFGPGRQAQSEFGGSAYAQYGSLFVAKVAVDSGKLDDAAAELKAMSTSRPTHPG
jgi:predicted negative regulator of RcsB-dependent stress response